MILPNDPSATSPYAPHELDALRKHIDSLALLADRLDPLTIHPVGRGLVEIHATHADRTVAMHVHEEDAPLLVAAPALVAALRERLDATFAAGVEAMRREALRACAPRIEQCDGCNSAIEIRDAIAAMPVPRTEGEAIIAAAAQAIAESEAPTLTRHTWPAPMIRESADEERHRMHDYSACVDPDCKRCKEIGTAMRELRWRTGRAAQASEPVWKEIDTSTTAAADLPAWRRFVAAAEGCRLDGARALVPVMKLAVPLEVRLSQITLAFDHRDALLRRQMMDPLFAGIIREVGDLCFGVPPIVSIAQGIVPPEAPTLAREDEAARAAGEVR